MKSSFSRFAFTCCFCATLTIASAAKDKDATAKVTHGEPFKSKSSFALGAFRVAFVTEDKVSSVSKGLMSGHGGSSSFMYGELVGVDHPLMQKIADRIYADFLKQAAAKGYTIVDSTQLAKTSPAYSAMEAAENFAEGRLGTVVIPTGQRSVPLAADDSAKAQRGAGAGSMMSSIHNLGTLSAKAEANKAFPEASKEAGVPVLGVTIVVNFADFKGDDHGRCHHRWNERTQLRHFDHGLGHQNPDLRRLHGAGRAHRASPLGCFDWQLGEPQQDEDRRSHRQWHWCAGRSKPNQQAGCRSYSRPGFLRNQCPARRRPSQRHPAFSNGQGQVDI